MCVCVDTFPEKKTAKMRRIFREFCLHSEARDSALKAAKAKADERASEKACRQAAADRRDWTNGCAQKVEIGHRWPQVFNAETC